LQHRKLSTKQAGLGEPRWQPAVEASIQLAPVDAHGGSESIAEPTANPDIAFKRNRVRQGAELGPRVNEHGHHQVMPTVCQTGTTAS